MGVPPPPPPTSRKELQNPDVSSEGYVGGVRWRTAVAVMAAAVREELGAPIALETGRDGRRQAVMAPSNADRGRREANIYMHIYSLYK